VIKNISVLVLWIPLGDAIRYFLQSNRLLLCINREQVIYKLNKKFVRKNFNVTEYRSMTKNTQRLQQFAKLPLALAIAASISAPASAFQFYVNDLEASIDTTLSAGASWRLDERSDDLVGVGNGGSGGSINSDDGNINFENDKTFSKLVKGNTDFLISYEDYGFFGRVKYWYDFELKDENRASDYINPVRELSADGKANASGAEILDAYVWADYWLGDVPLNLRLGKQVVSWGESTFIFNGINVINPVDIGAFRAPGAEIKDALLPVNMLYGSLGLTDDLTLEAFVQLEFEKTRIPDCGTFFSTVDYVADGCGPVYALGGLSETTNKQGLDGLGSLPTQLSRLADKEADDTDQFGVALRWYAAELNETEFGFYFVQYHGRFPLVSGRIAADTNNDGLIVTSEALDPNTGAAYRVEYAEKIQMLGASFNTSGPFGISLGGEYNIKHNFPVQLNSPDLVTAATVSTPSGSDNAISPIVQNRATDLDGDGIVQSSEAASLFGTDAQGFDLYDVSQIQMTAIKFVDQILGASRLAFVGEVGATYVHDLPDKSEIRYGRFDQLNFGLTDEGLAVCQEVNKVGGCDTDGYVSSFSWGYRMRASLTYNDAFAGVNLTPQVSWSHDMKGHAPGPGANFVEGRKVVGLSLRGDYLNQYSATLAMTTYFGGGKLNALSDRDNASLSVAYSF
jgi:hypothetical protein